MSDDKKSAATHDGGQDLATMLSVNERSELTLLVANITEAMRKQLQDAFDASVTNIKPAAASKALKNIDKNPNVDGKEEEAEKKEETDEEKELRKMREKREKDLSAPKMQELKKAALKNFEEWQHAVVQRLGEIVNSKKAAEEKLQKEATAEATPETAPPPDNKVIDENTEEQDADAALIQLYPPTSTGLVSLPKAKRLLLLHAVLLLLLSLENYDAKSRVLLLHFSSSLHLPLRVLAEDEVKVAQGLLEASKHMSGDEETAKRIEENKNSRRWKVGLASVAGAAIIGITGGLAAPLVAAGIGTVMGGLGLGATTAATLLGTLAESGVIVGSLFGAYGGRMTGKMVDAYAQEVEDFAFLPLRAEAKHRIHLKETAPEDRRLRVTIGISGWLTQKEDVITPWRVLGHESEVFALRWELKALLNMGNSMEAVIKSAAWTVAKKEIIARTVFASLMDALWPIALLKVRKIIDNPFSVAKNRADKAGLVLADALINRAQGERPVTLIGYSLGARLIYSCLMSLAERRAFGLVESVVLIGSPAPSDTSVWRIMRSVVSGRFVNVYSENDYILAFLYRTSSIQMGVAGLEEIEDVKGVENVDVSSMVSGHLRYQYLVGSILEKIGFEDINLEEVEKEKETLALLDEEEEEEKKKQEGNQNVSDEDVAKLEKDIETKNEESTLHWATEKLHLK